MAKRSTRAEAIKAEDQALRLAARGYTDREIGQALGLSESEARRKRQLALQRRRQEASEDDAWPLIDLELAEALRTAYRLLEASRAGSPPQVGALKVVLQALVYRARLRGIDLERPNVSLFAVPGAGEKIDEPRGPDASAVTEAFRQSDHDLTRKGREIIELERAAGSENVRAPEDPFPYHHEGAQP